MNLDHYNRIWAGEALTFVLSPRALWRLTGPDRDRYLNGQVTCDVMELKENQASYAAVCTAKGKMEGDLYIGSHGSELYLDAADSLRESLGARLDKYLVSDDAAFEDVSDSWKLSHVFGPERPKVPETCFVIANQRFGLPGHDVWVASTGSVVVGDSIGEDVVETIRIEQAVPRWGIELTTNTLPPEAGPFMLKAISYTKGCYVGQETIARLKSIGHVNKTLVLLQSDTEGFPAPGLTLKQGEKDAGMVTSSAFSPRSGKGMALAYVPHVLAVKDARFTVDELTLTITAVAL